MFPQLSGATWHAAIHPVNAFTGWIRSPHPLVTLTPFHTFDDSIPLMHLHLFLDAHEDEIRCCFSLCFQRHRMEWGERKCQTVMRLSVCKCILLCVNALRRAAQNAQYLHARNAQCARGRMQAPGACGQTTSSSRSPRQTDFLRPVCERGCFCC